MDAPLSPLWKNLVAEHFSVIEGVLQIGGCSIGELARRFGTPLFVYDGGVVRRTYRGLAAALAGFAGIHYSIKANPARAVVSLLLSEGAGIEIASVGEYRSARAAGAAPERMLFAGPGKRMAELEEIIAGGIGEIHLESYEEIERVSRIGSRAGRPVPVAVRINPVAAAQGGAMRMGGKPTPFGFDEEEMETALRAIAASKHLDLAGVHLYSGTQILDSAVLLAQWRHGIDVAARAADIAGRPLRTIDLGGGLGIPYFEGEAPLDLQQLSAGLPALVRRRESARFLREARIVVEPGRYLAGSAGIYVASVNAVKASRGVRFVVTDGGMHHHLAASGNLGQIIKKDYPILAPEKLHEGAGPPAVVVGPLCTPLDALARKAALPELAAGDLIGVMQSGAYGLTASPHGFLSHPLPVEIIVENGHVSLATETGASIPIEAIAP
ncbi:MAG: type III PLP-dependent enzyme [Devosia sp.]